MVLSYLHSFTGYLLRFPRASYGLISPPFLYRISFNVFPCFLWSYLISTSGYSLRFLVLLMVLPHPHSFTGYLLMFSRASYGLTSPPLLHRISFNVPRASYGLTSSPLLHRIYFKVFPCILWSYLIPTPSPDIF